MRIVIIALLALVGCADLGAVEGDDQCSTSLSVTPAGDAAVDLEVRVTAVIFNEGGGQSDVDWRVRFDQTDVPFTGNGSLEIAFTPHETGTYTVDMTPSNSGSLCPSRQVDINVVNGLPGDDVRLHVTPPIEANVPPIDRIVQLPIGTHMYSMGTVTLEMGRITDGTVGMQAYLRFMPDGQPGAIVETYTNASGAYSARVQSTPHHILVVPTDPAFPPQTIVEPLPGSGENYALSTGVAITGSVLRPNATPLAGAKVQVFMNDAAGITVPSTIATSAANGTFTLRAFAATGGNARVVVTPPAGSGLPRLEADSQTFNFTNAMTVNYGASLVTRNVSGTDVVRGGPLANAKVTIVGTIPFTTAGTVVAGASAVANGYVRIPMTADGTGALPSMLVPAADLYAVVEPANAPGDSAVAAFDTTTVVPATITAPAMIAMSTTILLDTTALGGARLELVPAGALGLAGVGPTVLYANESGVVTGSLAAGAIYEARFSDPSRKAAPIAFPSLDAAMVNTMLQTVSLPNALVITGSLEIQGGGNRIGGAAVQILCNSDTAAFACEGVERDRPIGEDASDTQGTFSLAVLALGPPI